jgi:hypothetical protein
VDETSINIKKVCFYLYRVVDSEGNTLEFLLSPTRDAEAATRFFCKALASTARSASQACPVAGQVGQPTALTDTTTITSAPRVITVDKNAAYPKAIADLKAAGVQPQHVELRQVKYLNTLIEQDHRAHQTLDEAGDGFLLVRDGLANTPRIRDDEHAAERTAPRGEQRGCESVRGQVALVAKL